MNSHIPSSTSRLIDIISNKFNHYNIFEENEVRFVQMFDYNDNSFIFDIIDLDNILNYSKQMIWNVYDNTVVSISTDEVVIYLHQFIMKNKNVSCIDGNYKNCRRSNLNLINQPKTNFQFKKIKPKPLDKIITWTEITSHRTFQPGYKWRSSELGPLQDKISKAEYLLKKLDELDPIWNRQINTKYLRKLGLI